MDDRRRVHTGTVAAGSHNRYCISYHKSALQFILTNNYKFCVCIVSNFAEIVKKIFYNLKRLPNGSPSVNILTQIFKISLKINLPAAKTARNI